MLVSACFLSNLVFFFQAEDGIRDVAVTGVQTCALPAAPSGEPPPWRRSARGLWVQVRSTSPSPWRARRGTAWRGKDWGRGGGGGPRGGRGGFPGAQGAPRGPKPRPQGPRTRGGPPA